MNGISFLVQTLRVTKHTCGSTRPAFLPSSSQTPSKSLPWTITREDKGNSRVIGSLSTVPHLPQHPNDLTDTLKPGIQNKIQGVGVQLATDYLYGRFALNQLSWNTALLVS
uniref:Uncharacterized protein n=1 Tax=Sphaerodactylus townsendi TaxID=933632 RepID=A0ACB8EPL6_9SAUR